MVFSFYLGGLPTVPQPCAAQTYGRFPKQSFICEHLDWLLDGLPRCRYTTLHLERCSSYLPICDAPYEPDFIAYIVPPTPPDHHILVTIIRSIPSSRLGTVFIISTKLN